MILILRAFLRGASFVAAIGLASSAFSSPTGYSVRSDVDRKLYSLDMATGVATELGATGFSKIEGLAINAAGEIYGVNPSTAQLVKCSATTGACVAVGLLTGLPQVQSNAGLAFSSAGVLYLAVNAVIYRVDPATAATVALGNTGPAISGLAGVSPTAACTSGIYGLGGNTDRGKFYCINITNGTATLLGTVGVAPLDSGLDGDLTTGLVWGVSNDDPGQVFAINTTSLAITNINTVTLAGKVIGGFESLAVARTVTAEVPPVTITPAANPLVVPTLAPLWLAALALLLATAAAYVFRARKFAPIRLRK
ncbi:MAG: hypothetical protein ABIZ64_18095 [Casimicrobium sp.]